MAPRDVARSREPGFAIAAASPHAPGCCCYSATSGCFLASSLLLLCVGAGERRSRDRLHDANGTLGAARPVTDSGDASEVDYSGV